MQRRLDSRITALEQAKRAEATRIELWYAADADHPAELIGVYRERAQPKQREADDEER